MRNIILIVILTLALCSCSSDEDIPLAAPGAKAPVCIGIYRTSEIGQVLGVMGDPGPDNSKSSTIEIMGPAPNPCSHVFNLWIRVSHQLEMKVWIVRCNTSESIGNAIMLGGASYYRAGGLAHKVFFDGVVPAGHHEYSCLMRDSTDSSPSGFYRVYAKDQDNIVWRDILYIRDEDLEYYKKLFK